MSQLEEGKKPVSQLQRVKLREPASPTQLSTVSEGENINTSRQQGQLVTEVEAFMQTRVQFKPLVNQEASSLIDDEVMQPGSDSSEDRLYQYLEQAANGEINLSDLHALSIEPRTRQDQCKAVLTYLINLRLHSISLCHLLKLQITSSSQHNDLVQEVAKLRAKLRSLENVKKEDLVKRLEAKELECLEYKAKLTSQVQPVSLQPPAPDLSSEALAKLQSDIDSAHTQLRQKMDQSHAAISELFTRTQSSTDIQETQRQLSFQLSSLRALQEQLLTDKAQFQLDSGVSQSRDSALTARNKYLEAKLAETLTQKEEQNIRLKSELVIQRAKFEALKQKIQDGNGGSKGESDRVSEVRQQMTDEMALKDLEVNQLREDCERKEGAILTLEQQLQQLTDRLVNQEKTFEKQLNEREIMISDLSAQLRAIDDTYSQRVEQINSIRETTQKRLNIEEQEKTMNTLKLDYLLNNNKKLHLQKKFLEKTLDKDMKNLQTLMNKAEIESQRDGTMISSQIAQQRLHQMYSVVKESLAYVKEVVLFMNFEVGEHIPSTGGQDRDKTGQGQGNDDSPHIPKKQQTQQQQDSQQPEQESHNRQGAHQQPLTLDKPLDYYFKNNLAEFTEVILTILCEIYQDSNIKTLQDTVHLFSLLQTRTNKQMVQEMYNKFFAQNKIRFIQHLSRTLNRNATLEREKAEMRRKLEDLNKELKALQSQKPPSSHQLALTQELLPSQQPPSSLEHQDQQKSSMKLTPDQVVKALVRFQEKKIIELQQQEMSALKSRMKEVRLNLQRQINDLQDQLQLEKEHHWQEIAKLRVEHGRDVQALHVSHQREEAKLKVILEQQYQKKLEEMREDQILEIEAVREEMKEQVEELLKRCEASEIVRIELDKELRKLKKKMINIPQGGHGTFSIVFEENRKYHGIHLSNNSLTIENNLAKKIGSTLASEHALDIRSVEERSMSANNLAGIANENGYGGQLEQIVPLEKLAHFIEVGFLMDQKNYRHIDTYKEKTFDSNIIKYLYEFQELFDQSKAFSYQNKLKTNLYENFALFNEINPVYISINLGRNVSPFSDENSLPQENFRLVMRHAFYLGVAGGDNHLMVNFLRCDDPYLVIRVVAFDNESNSSYAFDLIHDDLVIFTESNMKMLEPENTNDLSHMILNNLTLIKRKTGGMLNDSMNSGLDGGISMDGNDEMDDEYNKPAPASKAATLELQGVLGPNANFSSPTVVNPQLRVQESSLAVEYRIFFNEYYKSIYEKNKKFNPNADKKKKGLSVDQKISTDFEKGIVYEAYDIIFSEDSFNVTSQQSMNFELRSGRMSQNLILKVTIMNMVPLTLSGASDELISGVALGSDSPQPIQISQELCLYQSEFSKKNHTHQVTSSIIKAPEVYGQQGEAQIVAYVVSFEKIYRQDALVIRIANIQKYDPQVMASFKWDPSAPFGSGIGSITHDEKTIYLVRKNNGKYSRVANFEVLNTEIRSLLFKHSYGYDLTLVDFGKLTSVQSNQFTIHQVPALMPPEISPVKLDDPSSGLNFLFRDFGVVRVRTFNQGKHHHHIIRDQGFPAEDQLSAVEDDMNQTKPQNNQEDWNIEDVPDIPPPISFENHYAMFSFYDDFQCLSRGEIFLMIKIDGEFQNLGPQKLSDIHSDILKLSADEFYERIMTVSEREKLCKAIMEHIVIDKTFEDIKVIVPGQAEGQEPYEQERCDVKYKVVVDTKLPPMTEVIKHMKEEKQKLRLDENDICNQEFANPRALGITLNILAECPKKTQVSVINRKLFKLTSYFVNNMKNLKLSSFTEGPPERFFDFQLIYIDAETRTSTKSLPIVITERDIRALVNLTNNRQTGGEYKVLKDPSEILSSKVSRKRVLDFIIDSLVIDEEMQQLKISITHLLSRLQDRILLHHLFRIQGGRYLPSPPEPDPEFRDFKSSLPQIEMNKKLIVNVEKEFADRKYDIRIFEITIRHAKNQTKYQFEMFAVSESPQIVYRADFVCQGQMQGKKLLIERFNLVGEIRNRQEDNTFMNEGMVFGVLEQGFPHSVTFMLLEPISHIQWQHVIQDDKLNPIENRHEKEFFVKSCKDAIESGIWFNQYQSHRDRLIPVDCVKEVKNLGYQKAIDSLNTQAENIELWMGDLQSLCMHKDDHAFYQREISLGDGIYAEVALLYDAEYSCMRLTVNQHFETSFSLNMSRESLRFLSGMVGVTDRQKIYYIIKEATGYSDQDKAIRVILKDPMTGAQYLDLVLSEGKIVEVTQQTSPLTGNTFTVYSLKEELKFSFNLSVKESFALFQKIPDIITDFKQAFIKKQDRLQIQPLLDDSWLIHRKVLQVSKPHKMTFILFVKADSFAQTANALKVILTEQVTQYDEMFMFETKSVLTKEEWTMVASGVQEGDRKKVSEVITQVVESRLKIRTIKEDMQIVSSKEPVRYCPYFLEITASQPIDISAVKQDPKFDIRNGFRFSLMTPELDLPEPPQIPQELLLSQLERDDLLFDISEILNPFQLILRIKTFDRKSLKVLSVSEISEHELKDQLSADQVTYLVGEPSRRQELCHYLVQNMRYDEIKKKIYFLKSGGPAA